MGGGVAMQAAIRHPEKVRKVASISAVFRHDGWVKEALDEAALAVAFGHCTEYDPCHVDAEGRCHVIAPMITDFLDASLESFRQA